MSNRTCASDESELLSPREAAARLGVATSTVLKWIRNSHLPAFRRGRKVIRLPWARLLAALRHLL